MSLAVLWIGVALAAPPKSLDPAFEVIPFAREPDIVTPTGVAVDKDGAILVIECHTHFPLLNYKGPKFDRVLRFVDADGDGKYESRGVFCDGLTKTMGIAVHPNGWVWIATRSEIIRVKDADGDGQAEFRQSTIRLETKADYPHNGLCGFAIEPHPQGDVVFGLGENFGDPYVLRSHDGSKQTGGGEGGSMYRCRHDGGRVERIATGFWNPYHHCFDDYGRLFMVDNDPDDRPPCRLIHVVQGGDYGYRFRNGRKGTHPFTSWNGELPGTLPMVAGTGEAPSGMVYVGAGRQPAHLRGSLLVTSWGDHRIESHKLVPRGASFQSNPKPLVVGGEDFRPVGIAWTKHGDLIVSDWVDKSYNVHGKGRLWLVRRKERTQIIVDSTRYSELLKAKYEDPANLKPETEPLGIAMTIRETEDPLEEPIVMRFAQRRFPSELRCEVLRRLRGSHTKDVLWDAWSDSDQFVRQAALVGLRNNMSVDDLAAAAKSNKPPQRLGAAILLRMATQKYAEIHIPPLLTDPDLEVRSAAIQTVGERKLKQFRPQIVAAIESGQLADRALLAALATLDELDRVKKSPSDELQVADVLVGMLANPNANPKLVAAGLPLVPANHPKLTLAMLDRFLASPDPAVKREAVATLRERPEQEAKPRLLKLAREPDDDVRLDAVAGLLPTSDETLVPLFAFASEPEFPAELRRQALRSLRSTKLSDHALAKLDKSTDGSPEIADLVARLKSNRQPPQRDLDGWMKVVEAKPGDPAEGRRVFFHPRGPGCFRCHRMEGRGAAVGPDLTALANSMTNRRLVESILHPSKEIAPLYQAWTLVLADGKTVTAQFVGGTNNNTLQYVDQTGKLLELRPDQIEERKPSAVSVMPEKLADTMTDAEFRDLAAYLLSQKR